MRTVQQGFFHIGNFIADAVQCRINAPVDGFIILDALVEHAKPLGIVHPVIHRLCQGEQQHHEHLHGIYLRIFHQHSRIEIMLVIVDAITIDGLDGVLVHIAQRIVVQDYHAAGCKGDGLGGLFGESVLFEIVQPQAVGGFFVLLNDAELLATFFDFGLPCKLLRGLLGRLVFFGAFAVDSDAVAALRVPVGVFSGISRGFDGSRPCAVAGMEQAVFPAYPLCCRP